MQVGDEGGELGLVERHRGEVDDDGPADEERRRALDQGVELGQPVRQRQLRGEHEAHERAPAHTDRRARAVGGGCGGGGDGGCGGHGLRFPERSI